MIAHYLKTKKPRAKLVILDPKRAFSNQPVFVEAFAKYYKGIVELDLSTGTDDFSIVSINARTKEIVTKAGKRVKADVANIIPQQRAGEIAGKAGCMEGDWCPINPDTFASLKARHVYILGDAAVAAEMPKSASAANSQAKVVASVLVHELAKKQSSAPPYRDICWSLLAPEDAVKTAANYRPRGGRLAAFDEIASQPGEAPEVRGQNYQESLAWYEAVTADMFGRQTPKAEPGKSG
jgi:hypothetical protein